MKGQQIVAKETAGNVLSHRPNRVVRRARCLRRVFVAALGQPPGFGEAGIARVVRISIVAPREKQVPGSSSKFACC